MASTGTVTYSAEVIGNQSISISGFSISLSRSGSFPSTAYTITKVVVQRAFRNSSSYGFQIHADTASGTILSQAIDAQTGGGVVSSTSISSSYFNDIKSKLTSATETVVLRSVGTASEHASGELKSGSIFKIVITWKNADVAATLTLGSSSVACGSSLSVSGSSASSSNTYTVAITLAGTTWSTNISTFSGTTVSGSISVASSRASLIPNASSASATVTLTTKNGNTTIGTSTKTVTVTVPNSEDYLPKFRSYSATPQNKGTINGVEYVLQNYSYATIAATATAGTGATVKSISVTGPNLSKTVSSSSLSQNTGVFTQAGSAVYTIKVTDSRNRTASVTTTAITVTGYVKPTCQNLTVKRCTSDGDISATGTRAVVQGTPAYTAIGTNKLNAKIEIREATGEYGSTPQYNDTYVNGWIIQNGNSDYTFDADKRYIIRFTFSDEVVINTPVEIELSTAFILMRWEPQNSAFGYGCYPTGKKRVEIAEDWGLYHKGFDVLSCPVLWESTTAWSSGDQTVTKDLSEWQVVEAVISSGATGILTKGDNNIFRGVCFGGADGGFIAYMIMIAVNSATSLTMNRFEQVQVSHSKSPTVASITTQYGIVKLIGIKHV